ncbi:MULTISPECIES: Na+/H+ antiporter subunit D [unclassified Micromonospora]|uniref:Na+/H+ antiporter subunit D n=1 Tax=unclassified Micromonospora TaxID=2617518 RepID=UPI001C5D10EC|nr:Na+/H+ antiporter subunit D [Micromonospora sp. RL09-050-HVF-A]MBW4705522.1 Na+/H+ antiporter subunit D [Micromonospora sp. RL09-050-HVF-A]
MTALLPFPVVVPLLGAALTLILVNRPRLQRTVSVVALGTNLVVAVLLLVRAHRDGPVVTEVGGWPAPVGIVLVADQLAALMLVVSSAVTLCVLLYSIGQGRAETSESAPVSIYHPTYLVLTAGITNAFLAGDLFNLFVGFEILLAASFVLITLGGTEARIRTGSTYVVVSILSSMIFLAAVGLVYAATGTLNLAQLAGRLDALPDGVRLALQLMLLLAFGIKAAMFPLSAWLPDSYPTAPAPVTAVFAGLLTKVGVYAIIRTETLLFPGGQVANVLMVGAGLTMVVGVLGAVAQSDMKRLFSFTLVSHIGYMIFGVALSTTAALSGAIFYVVHHITIQTTLFLVAGLVEERAGSTDLRRLGGLARVTPLLAVLFFVPAMNLAGIPPFSGFLGKVGLLQAGVAQGGPLPWVLVVAGTVTSLLTLYATSRVWNIAFWRAPQLATAEPVVRLPGLMVGATTALVVLGLALTVAAGPLFQVTADAAVDLRLRTPYVRAVLPGGPP